MRWVGEAILLFRLVGFFVSLHVCWPACGEEKRPVEASRALDVAVLSVFTGC